jgi:hypothetical protein
MACLYRFTTMRFIDVFATLLVSGAAITLTLGARALTRSSDLEALYLLVVGAVVLRAASALNRREVGT